MAKLIEEDEDTPLDGKYLGTISKDFVVVADTLKEASYQLRARNISDHPIFPIAKSELPIGQLLIDKSDLALEWNYHFSFLDEFVQLQLILEDKLAEFVSNFRDPDEFACLFVVDEGFTKFVFIPFPEN